MLAAHSTLILLAILAASPLAWGQGSIGVWGASGTDFSQMGLDYDQRAPEQWSWSLSYDLFSSPGFESVSQSTSTLAADMAWSGLAPFRLSGGLIYSVAPSERFSTRGIKASVAYRWASEPNADPRLITRFSWSWNQHSSEVGEAGTSGMRRGQRSGGAGTTPAASGAALQIFQNSFGVSLEAPLSQLLSLQTSYTRSQFSVDLTEFLTSAPVSSAATGPAPGLRSAGAAFLSDSAYASGSFNLQPSLILDAELSISRNASTGAPTWAWGGFLQYQWTEEWGISTQFDRTYAPADISNRIGLGITHDF